MIPAGFPQALIPNAATELLSRRLLPSLMALLSGGRQPIQLACIDAMAEVLLAHTNDAKVVEQVCVTGSGRERGAGRGGGESGWPARQRGSCTTSTGVCESPESFGGWGCGRRRGEAAVAC